ncbi:family 2A encapsulin nanocompartment cargo protein cysteine desulfurase [Chitinophaga niabensis]|uniref:cysteine desulfurase n=1 Tax=Chitinophaga niabensis TaxID=536979 RepID=A0A1N6G737_9BACT|nr:family 2A encapsulin nanocompartment cargo protein cysteine desulfurase [Chitinophaga niabensis]SIO03355.1 cysteine desulfurase / selenocysteine lyase [Chitinophaga niabensis]
MSTSTNIPGFPDASLLQQLANQFFTALPGESVAPPAVAKHDPALHPGNNVDLNDPQTSLPDPNLSGGIPKSVAGSGVSPSSYQLPHPKEDIPFQGDHSFEWVELLKGIQTFVPTGQLPFSGAVGTDYYFLPTKQVAAATPPFDVNRIKQDFPILQERVNGRPLIWLDNAATTQKPKQVIDRISYFYQHENSNIHRAAHALAAKATDAYETARSKVQHFLNARSPNEIIFVRGATEGINLVAKSWGEQHLQAGDEIILSHLEHHANIVPWQQLALRKGLKLRIIPVDEDGQLILSEYTKLLNSKTKLVSFTQVSNALGTITPAKQITELAHQAGAKVLVDGAQSVSHLRADVQDLDADWFVFSGHKIFGPTGIGVVYGKEELLNQAQPWQGGGNMIVDVTFEHSQFHPAPGRFEAGTGNIADAVGLGAALDYVSKIGIDLINQYEHTLLLYGTKLLKEVPGLRLIGTAAEKASVLSFVLEGFKTEEVGAALNKEGIAVRSGHHCAQPILRRFGVESTVRPSLAFYNTCSDIDTLVATLHRLQSRHRH